MRARLNHLSTIGVRLKAERNRLGYARANWAEIAGVSEGTVSFWEAGKGSPSVKGLSAFAEVGADIYFILNGQRMPTTSVILSQDIRKAFFKLDFKLRRRLLLDLLAGEMGQ